MRDLLGYEHGYWPEHSDYDLAFADKTADANASTYWFEAFLFNKKIPETMRYLMKQKMFCLGDDFRIKNEAEEDVFFVDGRTFSVGNKLSFQDMNGNELAFIRQKLLSWGPTYEITHGNELMAVVKKELFTLFRCRFTVDVPGPDDLEAAGNFTDMEYTFTRSGQAVAQVSKRWFAFSDTYGVEIGDGENDVLILAATVVIDMVCHADNKNT